MAYAFAIERGLATSRYLDKATRHSRVIGFAWGLAEATLFFVVPDVWVSWVALFSFRKSALALAFVVAGSLVGSAIMFAWATREPARAHAVVERVPFVTPAMFQRAAVEFQRA